MNPETLENFIQKVQRELPEILSEIMIYWQDDGALDSLRQALSQMRSITKSAAEFNLTEVSLVSRAIADTLGEIEASQMLISSEQNQFLLEQFSNLDYLLSISKESVYGICANAETLREDFFGELEFSASDGGERSGENQRAVQSADSSVENSESDTETDEFEIDAEMLEIFALEAEDHLRNISANLSILENKNDDRDALLEIRRSAHTLKGSAGIVGFARISQLAHRVEDLLDYISDHGIVGNAKIFELLMISTDCLESLANGQNSPELHDKIRELYGRFDELIAFLQNSVLPAPEKIEAIIEPVALQEETAPMPPPESFVAPETATVEETAAVEAQPPASDKERRSVVRVSLERLDDLVKLASEMIVTRSTFENRLADLELQIQELLHSTNRLRRATGKLEIDFEASTLGSKKTVFQTSDLSGASPGIRLGEQQNAEFDSLEFDRYTEFHQTTRELIETAGDVSAIRNNFDGLLGDFSTLFDTQRRIVEEIQESLMRLRMVPLNSIASRIFRAVRVTAAEEGKLADLHLENGDIEIDTQILDAFVEPLLHLLRNAVAHGIESPEIRRHLGKSEKGKITFKAFNEGTHIVFVIADDGRGIEVGKLKEKAVSAGFITLSEAQTMNDEEAFSLIFLPGLSTSKQINQISGRGVGMNVVKSHITRRQGTISVKSEPQKGTSFTIRLPMSLAVTRALLVKTNEQNFAFPLKIVRQVVEAAAPELERATREKYLNINGKNYRFFNFGELVNELPPTERFSPRTSVLILENSENPCAVAVANILRTEEIVVKPLGSILQNVQELIGATIMGDGSVVPVLDLIYLVNQHQKSNHSATVSESSEKTAPIFQTSSVLIVDDSPSVRHLNSNLIKNAGWKAIVAKDGLEALEILLNSHELPCVILTDVEMPRMDGYEFLVAVKKQESLKEIPVIMITSRASDKHRRKAYEMGVSEYLNKPFEESFLLETIRRLSS